MEEFGGEDGISNADKLDPKEIDGSEGDHIGKDICLGVLGCACLGNVKQQTGKTRDDNGLDSDQIKSRYS